MTEACMSQAKWRMLDFRYASQPLPDTASERVIQVESNHVTSVDSEHATRAASQPAPGVQGRSPVPDRPGS